MQALGFWLWSTEERYQLKDIETLHKFLHDVGPNGGVCILLFGIKLLHESMLGLEMLSPKL